MEFEITSTPSSRTARRKRDNARTAILMAVIAMTSVTVFGTALAMTYVQDIQRQPDRVLELFNTIERKHPEIYKKLVADDEVTQVLVR